MNVEARADIASGDIVIVGLAGVAAGDIANGDDGVLNLSGVFELPKATAAGAMDQGAACYAVSGEVTDVSDTGNNPLIGYAFAAAGDSDAAISVRLSN